MKVLAYSWFVGGRIGQCNVKTAICFGFDTDYAARQSEPFCSSPLRSDCPLECVTGPVS
jgi:hypothetical protein